jgi:hypothetical protein
MLIAVTRIRDKRVLIAAEGIIQGYLGEQTAETRYAECREPPHYPVPAIRYEVEQDRDMITVWNLTHYATPKGWAYHG